LSLTNYSQINYSIEQGRFDNLTTIDEEKTNSTPTGYHLFQNYPNPFNPSTTIKFTVEQVIQSHPVGTNAIPVSLTIYNLLGEELRTLISEKMNPGSYEIEFDGSQLASGIYYYKLSTPEYSETKSMVLLK
jgi:hypothetical protein